MQLKATQLFRVLFTECFKLLSLIECCFPIDSFVRIVIWLVIFIQFSPLQYIWFVKRTLRFSLEIQFGRKEIWWSKLKEQCIQSLNKHNWNRWCLSAGCPDWWLQRRREYYWCSSGRLMSDPDTDAGCDTYRERERGWQKRFFSLKTTTEWERNQHTTRLHSALQTNTRRTTGNKQYIQYQPLQATWTPRRACIYQHKRCTTTRASPALGISEDLPVKIKWRRKNESRVFPLSFRTGTGMPSPTTTNQIIRIWICVHHAKHRSVGVVVCGRCWERI